ncbi:LysM peptidoglycan-binding domain-containing protein [Porifericola rhodea]|uniref:LysM peptidoglycan-binding domain-containing protein n=1 Tax=Porifericola rhodea TaxID=930972 RepID=UPI0026650F73|nr:LysM peptidoglycan-binding domain-containing protein [Porifericola rhodea]WKN32925.1 LysM peptidoglycan-binding domain-containing protein [Porifericola rhodea]
MYKTILLIGLIFFSLGLSAQHTVEVPSVIEYADMRLELSPAARKKIQTDVDALTRHEKYFNAKVKKVDTYLPLIEQVLREENVPDDIKYLVIQESALVGDAVSSSNAVGYWQFKAPTGREVGLTINNQVDERMNIITATHGAARYFKNNNTFFDNWLYALLAYYAGPGGALKIADKKYNSAKRMKLDGNTHWYVIKYLAHKIAFGQAVGKSRPEVSLFTYTEGNGKTLAQIAKEFNLQESDLEPYNKWVRKNRIPDDKTYYVIIPDYSGKYHEPPLAENKDKPKPEEKSTEAVAENNTRYVEVEDTRRFPEVRQGNRWGKKMTLVNNIPGLIADRDDNIRSISQQTGVPSSRLVKYNDLTSKQSGIVEGMPYYLKRKRNKAPVHYHVVEPGETLWSISQRFGIKLKKLMRNNRMREEKELKPGLVLWLRFIRPDHIPVEYREVPKSEQNTTIAKQQKNVNSTGASYKQKEVVKKEEPEYKPVITNTPATHTTKKNAGQSKPVTQTSTTPKTESPTNSNPSQQLDTEEDYVASVDNRAASAPTSTNIFHTVQSGETLYSIARKYNLTVPQLTSYNNISWEDPLKVGSELRLIPADTEEKPKHTDTEDSRYLVHEVKSGETMYKVARQYEVTIKDLMEWNEKEDFSVRVGEKLKVRKQ